MPNRFCTSPLLAVLECSSDAIAIVDESSGEIVYLNPALSRWLEFRHLSNSGLAINDILDFAGAGGDDGIEALLSQSEAQSVSARLRAPGQAAEPVEVRVCRLAYDDEHLVSFVIPAEGLGIGDCDRSSSRRDPLTGLRDRSFLLSRLAELLASDRAADQRFAVLFIDLDNFKQVNDGYGHLVGDNVLREVARRLASCVRTHDHVVRFGGDEFVVLAEQLAAPGDIALIVDRIHDVLKNPIELPAGAFDLTLSIGVAQGGESYRSPEDVLAAADREMYASKRSAG
jgi:diguanylate cyclase (GGDEF)-like protein